MHLLKKVTLSIVLLCLIASPITHAYDLSSAWHKPEHRVWVIRGAALCAVFLAMLAYYSFFAHKPKYTLSLSTAAEPAEDSPQDLETNANVEPSEGDVRDQLRTMTSLKSNSTQGESLGASRFADAFADMEAEVEMERQNDAGKSQAKQELMPYDVDDEGGYGRFGELLKKVQKEIEHVDHLKDPQIDEDLSLAIE